MSPRHIHAPAIPPAPVSGWKVTVMLTTILLTVVACVLLFNWTLSFRATKLTVPGTILETRQTPAGILNSSFGGRILYRNEALVRFTADGQQQTRWLVLTNSTGSENLTLQLKAHPDHCVVAWQQSHPENRRCALQ